MSNVREIDMLETITSLEVAEMVEKTHANLLKDIRVYLKQLAEVNFYSGEFFKESTYKDKNSQSRPCYNITKKGCEFIAHKLTGTKGTVFTARYINRFHEMEDMINRKASEPVLPWFIRRFKGKYIMLFRDFETITGVHLLGNYTALKRTDHLIGGHDYNGWGWHTVIDKEKFKQEYGFDYGDDDCMMYLYPCGIIKALAILENDKKIRMKEGAHKILVEGINIINTIKKQEVKNVTTDYDKEVLPVQINISIGSKKINIADINIV